jgi:hypothetical protein
MAGKVKNKDDGALQSKTARASMRTGGGKESYVASPDVSRIVPLGGGTHAYILDPRDGRTLQFVVASEKFVEALCELVEAGHGDRMRRDLAELVEKYPSFAEASERLESALAPASSEEEDAA